jgi:hypothetical protein
MCEPAQRRLDHTVSGFGFLSCACVPPRTTAIFFGLARAAPPLLSGLCDRPGGKPPVLLDLDAGLASSSHRHLRLMERLVEERLRAHLRQFVRALLLAGPRKRGTI